MNDMFVMIATTYIPPLAIACAIGLIVRMCFDAFCGRW